MLLDTITNSFLGSTFNVFSLSHKDLTELKMCIYLFCNFSERFNCKGNVKSMYSDYASGIAFLIKIQSLKSNKKKGTNAYCLWELDVSVWCFEWEVIQCTLTIKVSLLLGESGWDILMFPPVCMCRRWLWTTKGDLGIRFESFCEVCFYTCLLLSEWHNNIQDEYLMQCHFYMCPQEGERETHHVCGTGKVDVWLIEEIYTTYFLQVWYT